MNMSSINIGSLFRSLKSKSLAVRWWSLFESLGIIASVLSLLGIYLAWQTLEDQRAANRVSLIVQSWELVNKAVGAKSYSDTGHFAAVEYLGREGLLQGAKLEQIVLTRVTPNGYKGVVLKGADLKGANLSGASLQGADLSNADLRYASLVGANLAGADLTGAQLDETDMRGAMYDTIAKFSRGANFEFPTATVSEAQLKEACHVGFEVRYRDSQNARYVPTSNSCEFVRSNIDRKITPAPKRDLVQGLFKEKCGEIWGDKIKNADNCPDYFWPPGIADPG